MMMRILLARCGLVRPPMQARVEAALAALTALESHLAGRQDQRARVLVRRLHDALADCAKAAPPGAIDLAPLSAVPKPE